MSETKICIWCSNEFKEEFIDDWGICKNCNKKEKEESKKTDLDIKSNYLNNFVNKLPKNEYGNLGKETIELEVKKNGKVYKVKTACFNRYKIINKENNKIMKFRENECKYRSKQLAIKEMKEMKNIYFNINMEVKKI